MRNSWIFTLFCLRVLMGWDSSRIEFGSRLRPSKFIYIVFLLQFLYNRRFIRIILVSSLL